MSRKVTTHEAKTHLSKILQEVLSGAEVIICKADVPVAKLVSLKAGPARANKYRVGTPSSAKVMCSKDAFDPISDPSELAGWGLV
jgi:prevent-host-death family protein